MALTVEDGTGLTTADSYASQSDANTYHANLGNTAWAVLSSNDRDSSMRKAALSLDRNWHEEWAGSRHSQEQALDWPRDNAIDSDGFLIDNAIVPPQVKIAQYELALRVGNGDILDADLTAASQNIKKEFVKIGPLAVSQEFAGTQAQNPIYPVIGKILAPVTRGSAGDRLGRA